jgi:hypothetical protein
MQLEECKRKKSRLLVLDLLFSHIFDSYYSISKLIVDFFLKQEFICIYKIVPKSMISTFINATR